MLGQQLPQSAEVYAADQRAEIGAAVSAVGRLWGRMGQDFDASYAGLESSLLTVLDVAQERVAASALAYIPAVLAETGQSRALTARYEISPTALVGTAGDGLGTDSLAYEAVIRTKAAVKAGAPSVADALASGGRFLSLAVGTMLSDTGRTAEKMAAYARPVSGFVRMLTPPSCGRCIILAGQRTGNGRAFERHPGCDCRNIPASESIAGDLTVDSRSYLDGLDEAGLRKAFGSKANAQAYVDGADPNQIINAYRRQMLSNGSYAGGVRPAQVYNRSVKYTTEGSTRRGFAYTRMQSARYARAQGEVKRGRYTALRAPRLMPESIYQIATSKADADRLLRLYGWIL